MSEKAELQQVTIAVEGMMCEHCAARVEKALGALEGVEQATVNLEGKSASVRYRPDAVSPDDMKAAIVEAGYQPA